MTANVLCTSTMCLCEYVNMWGTRTISGYMLLLRGEKSKEEKSIPDRVLLFILYSQSKGLAVFL